MASSTHLIDINQLSLDLGGKRILHRISFQAKRGEFIGIVGPNGSGKTTLLRALDGLVPVSGGEIQVDGVDMLQVSARSRARKIAFMQQKSAGGVTFSALSVVLTGCHPYSGNRPTAEDTRNAVELLKKYGLDGYEERLFHTLSTGEQQIVLFCRALIQKTPVLLLDEPASNLDLGHQEVLMEAALETTLQGKTVLMALHDLNRAARYCDRLIVLYRGRKEADDCPKNLLNPDLLEKVWKIRAHIEEDPFSGTPRIHPLPDPAAPAGRTVEIYSDETDVFRMTRLLFGRGFTLHGVLVREEDPVRILWKELGIPWTEGSPDPLGRKTRHDRAFYTALLQ